MYGKKLNKGIVTNITDSSIQLNSSGFNISVKNIGFIRTLMAGAIYGPVIGAGTALFKNSNQFPINGSEKNWGEFNQYYKGYK